MDYQESIQLSHNPIKKFMSKEGHINISHIHYHIVKHKARSASKLSLLVAFCIELLIVCQACFELMPFFFLDVFSRYPINI